MARVTVDDCLPTIPNRFDLTLAAAYRARQIITGSDVLIEVQSREKPAVVALREIAAGMVDESILRRSG